MRALRDSNLPKFVQADFGIFLGLISDLFPRIDSPKNPDASMTQAVLEVLKQEGNIQPEDIFVAKTVDLYELLAIRHCVFVLGASGSAKSEVWKTLQSAQTYLNIGGGPCAVAALNPKSVTSDDLYGWVHPSTKEPYDGIIAKIMRDFSKSPSAAPKWVILDGDIDAEWIESMNTVMDDNKVLTLVSNERIPLSAPMRLIFEISHLRNASPATVSRAGVLFLNESDVGWQPFFQVRCFDFTSPEPSANAPRQPLYLPPIHHFVYLIETHMRAVMARRAGPLCRAFQPERGRVARDALPAVRPVDPGIHAR
jgi:dynein heavy chain